LNNVQSEHETIKVSQEDSKKLLNDINAKELKIKELETKLQTNEDFYKGSIDQTEFQKAEGLHKKEIQDLKEEISNKKAQIDKLSKEVEIVSQQKGLTETVANLNLDMIKLTKEVNEKQEQLDATTKKLKDIEDREKAVNAAIVVLKGNEEMVKILKDNKITIPETTTEKPVVRRKSFKEILGFKKTQEEIEKEDKLILEKKQAEEAKKIELEKKKEEQKKIADEKQAKAQTEKDEKARLKKEKADEQKRIADEKKKR